MLALTRDKREQQNLPDLNHLEPDQHGQGKGTGHLDILRCEQHLPPINAISDDTAEERKEQDGNLLEKSIQSQEER